MSAENRTDSSALSRRETISFREPWIDQLLFMNNLEDIHDVLRAIKQRCFYGEVPDVGAMSDAAGAVYAGMQTMLDRDTDAWLKRKSAAARAGRASAARRQRDAQSGSGGK